MIPHRSIRWLLVIAVPLVTAGCPNTCPPLTTPTPAVGRVEVIPHDVLISAPPNFTATFELEARLLTADGTIIAESDGNVVTWPITGASQVAIATNSGHRAIAKVTLPGTAVSGAAQAAALVNGTVHSNPSAAIAINPTGGGPDKVTAQHVGAAPPAIALLDGIPVGSASCLERVVSFVNAVEVGNFKENCSPESQLAVFSADWSLELITRPWTPQADNIRADLTQQPKVSVLVALWIAVADELEDDLTLTQRRDRIKERARLDIESANAMLRANRAGITLTVAPGFPQFQTASLNYYSCTAPFLTQPGMLNLYYVNNLTGARNGQSCPRYGAEDRILISTRRNTATLAHEVGHVLALMFPWDGHTNALNGFNHTNVMTDGLDDLTAARRSRFSLGQLYRMTLDQASWLNQPAAALRAGRPIQTCQCDPYVRTTCPRLGLDIASVTTANVPIEGWYCGDQLRVEGMGPNGDARALLSGRVWRTGACDPGLPGVPFAERPNALSLFFPNVMRPGTGPGGCPSHVSIFFPDHRAIFRGIPDGPIPWDLWLNQYVIEDHLNDPLKVPVNVWSPSGAPTRERDSDFADQVYSGRLEGHSNRTGIAFDWHSQDPATAWDEDALVDGMAACIIPANVVLQQINVYYVAGGSGEFEADGGFSCRKDDTYLIYLPNGLSNPSSSLAHHLGSAFGLADVSDADLLDSKNVMWHAPNLEGRTQFTLGQVFWMNFDSGSWLNSDSPAAPRKGLSPKLDCHVADVKKCPPLTASITD